MKTRFFKNHRDLSHELRNGRLDKLVPNFIKIGHQKADLFLAGNLGLRVQPPTLIYIPPRGNRYPFAHHTAKTPSIQLRRDLPPTMFLPRSCSSFPPGRGSAGTKRNDDTTRHRGVAQAPPSTIAPREFRLILSGIPLSLIKVR